MEKKLADLGQLVPVDVGRLGSDFVSHMMRAAEDYCVQQAIEAVRAGFARGLKEQPTPSVTGGADGQTDG